VGGGSAVPQSGPWCASGFCRSNPGLGGGYRMRCDQVGAQLLAVVTPRASTARRGTLDSTTLGASTAANRAISNSSAGLPAGRTLCSVGSPSPPTVARSRCNAIRTYVDRQELARSQAASHVVVARILLAALGQPIPATTPPAGPGRLKEAPPQRWLPLVQPLCVSLRQLTHDRTSSYVVGPLGMKPGSHPVRRSTS
jgi:hypothetical protein